MIYILGVRLGHLMCLSSLHITQTLKVDIYHKQANKNLNSEPITFIEILAAFNTQAVRMSTPARKRLMRDFKRLQQDPPAGISGAPYDNNIMLWNAVIFGPDDTPWDGGTFKLTLQFSEDYPNKPPTVRFVSRMFHPNKHSPPGNSHQSSQSILQQHRTVDICYVVISDNEFSSLFPFPFKDISTLTSTQPLQRSSQILILEFTLIVYADGSICLDILQNQWSPIYDVAAILTSIQSLLCDPNPNSPANSEAARMFSENKREYNRKVREIVEQSWTAD
ncbi:hypothetical protein H5410_009498 [Solanum commersonii]|uniref:UBC core domain-containing protein n=1 Tax=Solanum commersonii TaxID=4109 RepID=A0A9J6AI63_SOLCO|nr:hypothetical protein H5410_009498 [Solanum commersonii]